MLGFTKSKKTDEIEVTISNRTVVRVLGLVIGSYLMLLALQKSTHALTLIFVAFFLALALNSPVNALARRLPGRSRGSRSAATGVSFLIIIAAFGIFIASIVPPLVKQTSRFVDDAPGLVEDLRDENTSIGSFVNRYNLEGQVDKLSSQSKNWIGELGGSAFGTVSRVGSNFFSALTVLVLTFMMLVEGPRWLSVAKRLTPDSREEHTAKLAGEMYGVVRGYVNGQVLLAAIAALMISIPLFVLDVSYPIALVVIVFICGLIPLVGHTIGAVIVSFVALFTSPLTALIILGYYILYQQIENYAVQPRIQANSTQMSPLLVFASLIVGIGIGGLLGGLVAIPLAACLRILVLDYLHSRNYLSKSEVNDIKKNPIAGTK